MLFRWIKKVVSIAEDVFRKDLNGQLVSQLAGSLLIAKQYYHDALKYS